MTMARFPQTIFSTQRPFDDYGTDDMRCGDITESRLKDEFALSTISNVVDPYTLTRLTAFNNPQARFAGVYGDKRAGKVSVEECARLLFDELQVTSLPFSVYGPYRNLINQMFSHMQTANGAPFRDLQLDRGYREQILNDDSEKALDWESNRSLTITSILIKKVFHRRKSSLSPIVSVIRYYRSSTH